MPSAESLELALGSLSPGLLAADGQRVEVSGADTAVYERMRTAIPDLLSSYAAVAGGPVRRRPRADSAVTTLAKGTVRPVQSTPLR